LSLPKAAGTVGKALIRKKIIPGLPMGRWYKGLDNVLLVACTEKTTSEHIDRLAVALAAALNGELE